MQDKVVATEIMTTAWCPMDCEYCYIPKTDAMQEMHKELVEKLPKLLEKTDQVFDNVQYLSFWGTEPLLTLNDINLEEVDKRFPDLGQINFSTSLLTHTDSLIKFLNEVDKFGWDIEVQVSIDGPYTNQSRMKKAVSTIRENLKRVFQQTDGVFTLVWKSTITPKNIKDMNEQGVAKYFDFFEELNSYVDQLAGENVEFKGSGAPTLMVPGRYSQKDGKDFAKLLKSIHEYGYDSTYTPRLKKLTKDSYWDQIQKRPHTATCSGGDTQFGFDGDETHICHRTFYLNQDEYIESVKDQNQEENWDVSHFKSGTIKQIQNEFIANAGNEKELARLQYVMQNFHNYWELKLQMDKALIIELARAGQINERYLKNSGARDLFALFLNVGLSCPVESVMNTNTLFATPISEIRMFGNGAMQELERRIG